ncbi:histidine kinase [Streptomyces sp. NBC_00191]|uniref:sensor histidine kinase n=1 Tax=Streptomyces sp. NBC_00191 TaxID=2975674 RepID=UPI003254A180
MRRVLGASARALFGTRAGLRWLHLILGGALLMPYWLVGTVIVGPLVGAKDMFTDSLPLQFGAYGIALPMAAVTALLFPLTRPLAVALAKALCGVPAERFAEGPARSRDARLRASGWFTLHAGIGALISGATLALPPFAVSLMVLPFFPALRGRLELPHYPAWQLALFPFAGMAMLTALAACAAAAGALLARQAPVLLGPTPADRLAAAERRATELAERNRLARELHDSVGHALSAVTLQAGAARRVLDSDPEFVREALAAIEETTRRTVGELDSVLGLLRQDDDHTTQLDGPTLDTLDGLLARSGVPVSLSSDGDLAAVPATVSREAYRIVQEGLSNALRHAGASPVTLWIALCGEELEITMENPLPDRAPVVRPGGGRGVRGIAERAALLGGRAQAGAQGTVWLLSARLPLGGDR